jgi:redox-sensitive bicupin YhaK (pirin superfamily)
MGNNREIQRIVDSMRTFEGAGFPVRRPFPTLDMEQFDPFLLLDHFGPVEWAPGEAEGAPDHPHRGFETVSYILEGDLVHADSHGHSGRLGPGDVQWMTAGDGVIHSEMPSAEFRARGGRMHGFQIWVNLPRVDKRMHPRYQDVSAAHIPTGKTPDGKVRVKVIAGEALGQKAVIATRTPILLQHFTIAPGGTHLQPVAASYQALAYVFVGTATVAGARVGEGQAAFLDAGDAVALGNDGTTPAELLLLGGVPLHEPVARYGPFVMNTREEILAAMNDFRAGRMGIIPADVARQ